MTRFERVLAGAVAGSALWLLLALLGIPFIFGIGIDAGLIPFFLAGALLSLTRGRLVFPILAVLLFVAAMVVAYTDVAVEPARKLIRTDKLPDSADAVVVLSGGVNADGLLTQQGADRALKGVELVEKGVAPVLVFTREEKKVRDSVSSSTDDQKRLAALADLDRVISTRRVRSTHDEALSVLSIARYRGWRSIIVVTSPFHSRRACATFEKAGLRVSCVPSDSRDVAVRHLSHARDRITAFGLLLYETAGTLRYRQLGWI